MIQVIVKEAKSKGVLTAEQIVDALLRELLISRP